MNTIALYNTTAVSTTSKTGITTDRLMLPAEFKKFYNVKGQEAKRRYAVYIRDNGKNGRINALANVQAEEMLLTAQKRTKTGILHLTFAPASKGEYHAKSRKQRESGIQLTAESLAMLSREEKAELLAQLLAEAK